MHPSRCVLAILLFSVEAICQNAFPACDVKQPLASCLTLPGTETSTERDTARIFRNARLSVNNANREDGVSSSTQNSFVSTMERGKKNGVRWGRVLLESFELLSVEQAYVVHDDWRWVGGDRSENGVPFNHYWRDYKQSLSSWVHSGWSDGDPNMYGYVGHPIQGVASSYIFIQNDPKGQRVEFSKRKEYWHSRLKATLWNAVYSTQWNLGPLSEMTIEKYGTHWRPPWNQDGSWPCTTKHCYTGVGQIDLVMTPVAGFGWLVGEDILDRFVTRRVEGATRNRFLIDVTRCGLDPIRVGTNILHGKRPWYRSTRDAREVYLARHYANIPMVNADASASASH